MQDVNYDKYKQGAITVIDDYIAGKTSAKSAADWALKLVISSDFERLPKRICYAVHLIFDLHDEGKPWCPTKEELKNCKKILLNESVTLPPFVDVELKSRTRRGLRKEIRALHRKMKSGDNGSVEKP